MAKFSIVMSKLFFFFEINSIATIREESLKASCSMNYLHYNIIMEYFKKLLRLLHYRAGFGVL